VEPLIQAIVALLAIADPLGAVPVFWAVMARRGDAARRRAATRVGLAVLLVLGAAALGGGWILAAFGVSLPAFRAGGGLVVLLMGLEMLSGHRSRAQLEEDPDVAEGDELVPVAMPLIAGPGAIATVVTLEARAHTWRGELDVVLAVAVTAAVVFGVLHSAAWLQQHLSEAAHRIFLRFMGLVLIAIGAQLLLSGVREFFWG